MEVDAERLGGSDREGQATFAARRDDRGGGSRPGWLDPLADAARLRMERDGADWVVIPPASVLASLLGRYGAGANLGERAAQSGLGRASDGLADWGDGLRPSGGRPVSEGQQVAARWLNGSWEGDVARMARDVPRRGDRLWTLGNGVVPEVGEVLGWLARTYLEAQRA